MPSLFSKSQQTQAQINAIAARSKEPLKQTKSNKSSKSTNDELRRMSNTVQEYFKDSKAILITSVEELHNYIDKCIEIGYAGIDTETTGLDRINDTIVGASLFYPGGVECYIPNKHRVPIIDEPYKGQLTYEEVGSELQRLVDNKVKLIFANADFDLSMIYKDYKVDLCDICYYDVILAWRCIKEDELRNDLKSLYNKYVLKGEGDPKKFNDFFSPQLFPYCKPDVAKLYAANDAKITYELFAWQLPYVLKDNPKCQKHKLEHIADLIWGVEFPLMKVVQKMHRTGIYLEKPVANMLHDKYIPMYESELKKLQGMVQDIMDNPKYSVKSTTKKPFVRSSEFNPSSPLHVKYLLYDLMKLPTDKGTGTGKEILAEFNLPVTNQILHVRSLHVLISTFVEKLPNATSSDSRIHCQFKQIGADTGRLSSAEPKHAYWALKIKLIQGRVVSKIAA